MQPIPYGKQTITDQDIKEVEKVLKSDFLTQGPQLEVFEKQFADYIGCKYSIAVANGTAALHLSILALDINPGDKVITTPITFAASANAVRYAGGEVIFADIDPETYILDIKKVEEILENESNVRGIIPVDFAGYPVDLESLRKLADKYNIWILEDACHAPGGYFVDSNGIEQRCGNGQYADLAIFSFHPVKHIATGEGGMITTNNEKLFKKLMLLRTHGITKDPDLLHENHGGWYYEMQELGYNYRLSDIHAALGVSQLRRAKTNLDRRKEIAEKYDIELSKVNEIKTPKVFNNHDGERTHAYHLYIIQTENRKALYDYMRNHQIYTQVHYIPLHLQPYYKNLGWKKGDFPIAESYYDKCLSLPMYHGLHEDEQNYVIEKIIEFYANN